MRRGLLACFLCVLLAGCGGTELTAVSGVVSVDGQVLQEGSIRFAPLDGKAPSQAAMIQGGKFDTLLHRTKYQVQIFAPKASKVTAPLDVNGPGGGPTVEELLPPRYNIRSELTLEVAGPKNDVRFDLTSK